LQAGGSTNGGAGIQLAYDVATQHFLKKGTNRVILATDGDFNVGVSSDAELVRMIEQKRDSGVYLTVLGYGMGNLKDNKLEQLAHHGNGHYAYIDTIEEARKVFVDQGGALAIVAKDVKLQVEFNHKQVNAYRLVGYENRVLRNEDFRDDTKDAGDMGSGHTCTALYEIVPVGVEIPIKTAGELKYQKAGGDAEAARTGEWLTVRMRYKHPDTEEAKELEVVVPEKGLAQRPSVDFRFAAAVAAFGMLLRDSDYRGTATYQNALRSAEGSLRDKKDAYREEFARLVRVALTIEQAKQLPKK
jgi:Ca-activated chloride channel homolog